jgi:hypothetical protein
MNSTEQTAPERSIPRWLGEAAASEAPLSAAERTVLREVLAAIRRVRHGSITLAVQDGRVVQLDVTEKKRL